MRTQTKVLLEAARNEKDVENAYRGEITHSVPLAGITSPHGTDGYAQWGTVRALLEFKYDKNLKAHTDQCGVLGQMILYLKKFEASGHALPNVLFVGDKNECFALETSAVQKFLALPIDWKVSPSTGSPDLTQALIAGLDVSPFVFDVADCDFREVLSKIDALSKGFTHRVRASKANINAIFLYWRGHVFAGKGKGSLTPTEQVDVFLRCLFHPDDVALHPTKRGVLIVPGYDNGVVINPNQYKSFFSHFVQGYKPSEVEAFYADKDRLIEDDARRRQGAFFTPRLWVDEAHREIEKVLGPNWRRDCVVWDPAAGTGNLTRDYTDWGCLISSTCERPDVNVMRDQGWGGQHVFQYDFLNPGADSPFFAPEDGDNRIPVKVEKVLREAVKAGKRLVVLMNPPYAEDGEAGAAGATKKGVALTKTNLEMGGKMGRAARQLYAQFMYRVSVLTHEYGFKNTTAAMFSKPTFMCSGSYRPFRAWWYGRYGFKSGFLFQASHFADVSDAWGVLFSVWNSDGKTDPSRPVRVDLRDVVDFRVVATGVKALYNSDGREASRWVDGLQTMGSGDTPKFSSGLKVVDGWDGGTARGALGVLCNMGNNLMKSGTDVYLLSGKPTHKGCRHFDLAPANYRRCVALFGARKLVEGNWVNDKDEYLAPNEVHPEYHQWVNDCHVYALLHGSNNCTAMRDVQYKGKVWRIKNHWFWRTRESTLRALDTAKTPILYRDCQSEPVKVPEDSVLFGTPVPVDPWEVNGDAYFAHLSATGQVPLSPDAARVLELLDALWVKSLPVREDYAAGRPELHLMAWDAGLYQLKHLWRDLFPTEWAELQRAFKALSDRLRPGVYGHGFLRA